MKQTAMITFLLLAGSLGFLAFSPTALAATATDGYYQLSPAVSWEGTTASRLVSQTYTYGDESSLSYTLPWAFSFYGQAFSAITVDTNGNIWFGTAGGVKSFNLASNGVGRVISAWNNDLSSYYYGGVFIQHKIGPERVVIEWQTETYTNEGLAMPNDFEVVLYPNGNFNMDYRSFSSSDTNKDFGSGVSLNDGNFAINLTSTQGNVFGLSGRSFSLTPTGTVNSLDVSITGGTGKVTSNLGISWTGSNPASFPTGTHVTLQPVPGQCSYLQGWGGACSGTGACTFVLNQNTAVTAQMAPHSPVRIVGKGEYPTLQAAYNAASDGDTIQAAAITFTESLAANGSKAVTIDGGYLCDFTSNPGITLIQGMPHISAGNVRLKNFRIGN